MTIKNKVTNISTAMEKNKLYIFDGLSETEVSYFLMMSETQAFSKGNTIISE